MFFRVLQKRPDGYHDIASLFQAVDLFDRLFFCYADADALSCTDPAIPKDNTNLVARALALFRRHYPLPPVQIHIEKRIPVQAGLGGGSSNAATALWGFNELAGRPYTQDQLIQMGAEIGSDVPFFFSSGAAYCTGRGEILEPYHLPEPLSGFIAKPAYGLSTPLVYQNTRPAESLPRDPRQALSHYPQFFNDLETPAFRLEPRLAILQRELRKRFATVVMTGSGTAFFCLRGEPSPIPGVVFYPFGSLHRPDLSSWYTAATPKV